MGSDTLRGGAGNDIYLYRDAADSTSTRRDAILDFAHGDKIDLAAIDAQASTPRNQDFSIIGSGAFTGSGNGSAGQLRAFLADSATNAWRVEGDVDGDRVADLALDVSVSDGQALVSSDSISERRLIGLGVDSAFTPPAKRRG